jgi:hypothetical protein
MGSGSFAVLTLSAGTNNAFAERQRSNRRALLQQPEKNLGRGISPARKEKEQSDGQPEIYTRSQIPSTETLPPRSGGVSLTATQILSWAAT